MRTSSIILLALLSLTVLMLFIDYKYDMDKPGIGTGFPESVVIDNDIVNELNNGFLSYPEHEFAMCLSGYEINNIVYINNYFYPKQTPIKDGLIISPCTTKPSIISFIMSVFNNNNKVYGSIHNHANGVCRPSETDVYTFGRSYDSIMGIICGQDAIAVYTPDSLSESIPVVMQDL